MKQALLASRRRRELLAAAVAFAIVLSAAYGNVVFGGKSLVYSDNYNPIGPSPPGDAPDATPHAVWARRNLALWANFHDPGGSWWQWEPAGEFLRKGLRRGELPFWDPYVGAGAPAMANLTSTFFFPPYFLLVLLGNTALLKNVYFLAVAFSAGLATYVFLRQHELNPRASFFGGAAYVFSGAITQNIGSFLGQTLACLPVVLAATGWFFVRPTWRRAGILSVVYAAASLSSFPPVLLESFGLAAFYALVQLVSWNRHTGAETRLPVAVRYAAAVVLSLGLVAFYYIPAFEVAGSLPYLREAYAHGAELAVPVTNFYGLLSPLVLGGTKVFAEPLLPRAEALELPYVGVTALLATLLYRRSRVVPAQLFSIMAWTAVLLSLKMVGAAPVQYVAHVPGLKMIHFAAYSGMVLDFALVAMAAVGVHSAESRGTTAPRAVVVALAASVLLLGVREFVSGQGLFAHPLASLWVRSWHVLVAVAAFVSLLCAANAWVGRARARRAMGNARVRAARWAIGCALVGAVLIEGMGNTVYPRQRRWNVWRHPLPYVKALTGKRGVGRVWTTGGALSANAASAFEVFGLDSLMAFNAPRVYSLYRRYVAPTPEIFLRQASQIPPDGVLDAANITDLVVNNALPVFSQAAASRAMQRRYADAYVTIFRRPSLPRYFFTTDYALVSESQALEAVAVAAGRRVLVEEPPSFPSAANSGGDPRIEVKRYRRNGYTLEVAAPTPGLVYCSEADFPGWSARVNGLRARILQANYAFRAVEVPAGTVTVEMSYWPRGLTVGLVLTVISVGAVAFAIARPRGFLP